MTARLNPGEIFEQRYRIERHVCDGAMGSIYQATHLNLDIPVAVKVARLGAGEVPQIDAADIEDRFLREARAAAHVRNEHVTQVLDSGRSARGDVYMVLEFLSGFDLAAAEIGLQLSVNSAVECAIQVCRGMAVAHERGVVHRDLKPSNLFVTRDVRGRPLIKILDFGISRYQGARPGVITNSGSLIGSPCYVSPEQARESKQADARSDIWSLGVVLYELLTGQLPFDGDEVGQVLSRVLTEEPLPPRSLRPEMPEALDAIVMQCLSKKADHRPQSMAELAELLTPFSSGDFLIRELVRGRREDSEAPPASAVNPSTRRGSGLPPPKPRGVSQPPPPPSERDSARESAREKIGSTQPSLDAGKASSASVRSQLESAVVAAASSRREALSAPTSEQERARQKHSPKLTAEVKRGEPGRVTLSTSTLSSTSKRNIKVAAPSYRSSEQPRGTFTPASDARVSSRRFGVSPGARPSDSDGLNSKTWVWLTAAAIIGVGIGILRLQNDESGLHVPEKRLFAASPALGAALDVPGGVRSEIRPNTYVAAESAVDRPVLGASRVGTGADVGSFASGSGSVPHRAISQAALPQNVAQASPIPASSAALPAAAVLATQKDGSQFNASAPAGPVNAQPADTRPFLIITRSPASVSSALNASSVAPSRPAERLPMVAAGAAAAPLPHTAPAGSAGVKLQSESVKGAPPQTIAPALPVRSTPY